MAKSNATFDTMLRYNPLYYGGIRAMLQRFDGLDQDLRRELRDGLVRRALRWAESTVAGTDRPAEIGGWPLLEKSTLRDHGADFARRRFLAVPAATGGTTGLPIRLWRSPRNIAAEQAFFDHILSPTGHTFRTARIAVLRGDNIKAPSDREPPFGKTARNGRRLLLSSQHLGADTVAWYVEALQRFAPDILWIYPSTGESLARNIASHGLALAIPIIYSSSEVLHTAARNFMAEVFGAQIIDSYGQAERVALAFSYRADEYFFHPAYGHVELHPLPIKAPEGMALAEIVGTGLWNEAMPLIRYRTGDRVIYPANYSTQDLALAGLGLKPVLGIMGRDSDYLISPRGEVLVGIDHLPREVEHILRLQIIQDCPHTVRIRVVPGPEFAAADRQHLMDNARLKLPADMVVHIEEVEELDRLPSGKVPYVVRRQSN